MNHENNVTVFGFPFQEVIELTKDLLSTQPSETLASSDCFASTQPTHSWKVGDKCMAIWSEDGQ